MKKSGSVKRTLRRSSASVPCRDDVNNPAHYTQGRIEVHDFILDQKMDWDAGNVVKYLCRYRHKGTALQDLKKARWYLNSLIRRHGGE